MKNLAFEQVSSGLELDGIVYEQSMRLWRSCTFKVLELLTSHRGWMKAFMCLDKAMSKLVDAGKGVFDLHDHETNGWITQREHGTCPSLTDIPKLSLS